MPGGAAAWSGHGNGFINEVTAVATNPYTKLPAEAYWRTGVARHAGSGRVLKGLWRPGAGIRSGHGFLTVGSCFAQHIGRALDGAGLNRMLVERAPGFLPASMHEGFGFGVFSFRVGNVYTAAMLLQWLRWARDPASQDREVWSDGTVFFDPVRPGIEPGGFETVEDLWAARDATLAAMRRGIAEADVLIFTLGLTEMWVTADTGLVLASCPGTQAGTFDPERHRFANAGFASVSRDLEQIRAILREMNPDIRLLLTVSPVPLTATAEPGAHVLVSTVQSKSILRAAAGEMARNHDDVDYFPSYEIVSHPALAIDMFEADRREVRRDAVALVMRHFLDGLGVAQVGIDAPEAPDTAMQERIDQALAQGDAVCDDLELDRFNDH